MVNIRKILITGQSGLAATHILPRLDSRFVVTAVCRNPVKFKDFQSTTLLPFDLNNLDAFDRFLGQTRFDIIINCAAISDVDKCETERKKAGIINADAVAVMAERCRNSGAILIHLSTDYIFDGAAGPYAEDAKPCPINFYGVTKLESENMIAHSGCNHVIVRTNHLYGNGPGGPSRLIRSVLDNAQERKEVLALDDQFSNPTWAGNLADAIAKMIEIDFRGIINVGGADYVNRYDFALIAADIFGIDKSLIKGVSLGAMKLGANRPLLAGLKVDKMRNDLGIEPIGLKDGLRKVYEEAG